MNTKTIKITYWVVTILFCLVNFSSGIAEFFPNQESLDVMKQLGYPAYLFIILGVAEVLGSIAIIQTKFRAIKEWAYAGFAIDFIGASASFYFINGGAAGILLPLVFLAILFVSYFLGRRLEESEK